MFLLSHRLDLALAAKELGFDVHIASANENEAVKIRELGFSFHPFYIAKYGKNPFQDAVTFFQLLRLYHKIQPTILHHVTIKPVIYGSFAARFVPSVRGVVNAIPGLGYLFSRANFETSLEGRIVLMMYKAALGLDNSVVITQNPDDEAMLLKLNLAKATQIEIISGSGVDDALFTPANRELVSENCRVAFVGRLLHQKGIVEFVAAANSLVVLGIKATFVVAGDIPVGNPGAIENSLLQEWIEQGVVEFVGHCKDMPSFYEGVDVVCLPSYGEGFPKVLVEALACGMELDSNLLGTRNGKKAQRFAFKNQGGVGGVMDHHQLVLLGK